VRPLLTLLVPSILALACVSGCAPAAAVPSGAARERHAPSSEPGSSVALPVVTVTGCVESRELKSYVLALETERTEARARALAALGASSEQRRGSWAEPGLTAPLDQVVSRGERRFGVVAELAAGAEPVASLARTGHELRRIDERARGHAVSVVSCSERRCPMPPAAPAARSAVRPLLVELAPGESLGAPLALEYDYWRADVDYARSERCPPGD